MITLNVDFNQRKETQEEKKIYTTEEILTILKENLPNATDYVDDKIIGSSKYVRLAYDYNYDNYKLCTINDLIRLNLLDSFSYSHKKYFQEIGASIAIFNELNGKLVSVVFRSVSGKNFTDLSLMYSFYGYDMIDPNFKYGDYLILTEGIYDADSLRPLFPNVLAMLTSNITMFQAQVLQTMTDKFIIAFDNDDAGQEGFKNAVKRLENVQRLNPYYTDKDLGVMEEIKSHASEFQDRREYYENEIKICTSDSFEIM